MLSSVLLSVLASIWFVQPSQAVTPNVVPLFSAQDANVIDDHYIVVLKDTASVSHVEDHLNWLTTLAAGSSAENRIKHTYNLPDLQGYAGKFEPEVLDLIRGSEHVAYVERDQVVRLFNPIPDYNFDEVLDSLTDQLKKGDEAVVQANSTWGLSRISHREKLPSKDHQKKYPYVYPGSAGQNVTVYVIDTGINVKHVEFEGRAFWGATIPEDDEDIDGNGHGTHCAGTIAGKTYGVSKKAFVVAVKVLSSNGSGTMSDVIAGVEWAAKDHQAKAKSNPKTRSVANMSLGGGRSRALDAAVNAATRRGVFFAVAAGNDNRDACNYSPAAATEAVTVGASTIDDRMAWFSNHGKCVDVFAPGKDILSTWIGSNVATNTISGTSMASPHVAGLIALLLGKDIEKTYTNKEMKDLLVKLSTKDVIQGLPKKGGPGGGHPKFPFPWPPGNGDDDEDSGKTPNRLIFNGVSKKDIPDDDNDDGSDNKVVIMSDYDHVFTRSGEKTTPGFEHILDAFVAETLHKTGGIIDWMKKKVQYTTTTVIAIY